MSMKIKEQNIYFSNELSHTFPTGIPDISSNSIRLPAFNFSVFTADNENGDWHESALLVFDGVVSSTRKVKLYANRNTVDGPGDHQIVDGPFSPTSSDQQLYHFHFSVYPNPPDAWVDWDIVAASVRVEQIDKQTLIYFAQLRNVPLAAAISALEGVDRGAITLLLDVLKSAPDYPLILLVYCRQLIQAAKEKGTLPDIADVLIQRPNRGLLQLANELSSYHTERSAALIRDITVAGIDASAFVIKAIYSDDNGITRALLDPAEPVRILAAKKLEERNDISGLIQCLNNESPRVREIAGWYMGRKTVSEAEDAMIKEIATEKFTVAPLTHAQVEALRSAIWALGILNSHRAQPYLELLTNHESHLIRDTAVDVLSKLT